MYLVTRGAARKPVAKRPHDEAEKGPRKVRKTEGREQAAPREDKTPPASEKRHDHRADKVSRKVRKGDGRYHNQCKQKPTKTILPGEQEKRQPQIVLPQHNLPRPDP